MSVTIQFILGIVLSLIIVLLFVWLLFGKWDSISYEHSQERQNQTKRSEDEFSNDQDNGVITFMNN